MDNPAYIALAQNAALLLAMVLVFDLVTNRRSFAAGLPGRLFAGVAIGVISVGLVIASFRLETGIVFDTRSVLLSTSGLFFGAIPTFVAMAMAAAFRLWQGGAGAWTGTVVILATGGVGIGWRRWRRGRIEDISMRELYVLGLVTHLVMLALMLTLPSEAAWRVLAGIALPVMLIYPVATTVLGMLLVQRLRREATVSALAESEGRYRRLAENASDLIYRFRLVPDRCFEYVSPAATAMTGYTPEEHYADPDLGLKLVHPDDRSLLQATTTGEVEAGRPLALRWVRKDGTVIWTEQRNVPIYDEAGRLVALEGIARDITAQKQAEEALLRSKALLEAAGRVARFGGWSVNLAENMVTWSDEVAAIHEAPPDFSPSLEEGISFYAPEWQERITEVFGDCAQRGLPYDEEMEILTMEGNRVWVRTTGDAVRDETGAIIRVEGAFQDITAKKQTEAQLAEQLKELRRWHDVTLGREQRIIELKREVNALLAEAGQPPHYLSVIEDTAT
jgi:PAS domain S-box-containing protein